MKPEMIDQYISVFDFGLEGAVKPSLHEKVWLWVPLIPVSQNQGLPGFHRGVPSTDWPDIQFIKSGLKARVRSDI